MLHAAVASALVFADIAMDMLVHGQAEASAGEVEPDLEGLLALRVEVYQAQGMVTIDLGVTLAEAMALLNARARVHRRASPGARGPGCGRRHAAARPQLSPHPGSGQTGRNRWEDRPT